MASYGGAFSHTNDTRGGTAVPNRQVHVMRALPCRTEAQSSARVNEEQLDFHDVNNNSGSLTKRKRAEHLIQHHLRLVHFSRPKGAVEVDPLVNVQIDQLSHPLCFPIAAYPAQDTSSGVDHIGRGMKNNFNTESTQPLTHTSVTYKMFSSKLFKTIRTFRSRDQKLMQ